MSCTQVLILTEKGQVMLLNNVYIHAKMIPLETIPGMGQGRIKDSSGRGDFKYSIFGIL
jgi:hypothetical protein